MAPCLCVIVLEEYTPCILANFFGLYIVIMSRPAVWIFTAMKRAALLACIHTYIQTCIHMYIWSFIYLFIYLLMYLFIYLFIHSFIHSFIHFILQAVWSKTRLQYNTWMDATPLLIFLVPCNVSQNCQVMFSITKLCLSILGHIPEANLAKELQLSLDVCNELWLKTIMNVIYFHHKTLIWFKELNDIQTME